MSSAFSLVRKIRHSALVRAFDKWEVHLHAQRQIRSKTIKMLRIFRCNALVRAFDKLKAHFQAQRQIRTKTIKILRRRIQHTLARAVLSTHTHTHTHTHIHTQCRQYIMWCTSLHALATSCLLFARYRIMPKVCVCLLLCRTYYEAVCGGGGNSEGHVL